MTVNIETMFIKEYKHDISCDFRSCEYKNVRNE